MDVKRKACDRMIRSHVVVLGLALPFRGLRVLDEFRFSALDVRLGLRMIRKHPGLSVSMLWSLGLRRLHGSSKGRAFNMR